MSKQPFEGPPTGSTRADLELDTLSGHHSEDLFDQNEDAAGEKNNLATGKPINNSKSEIVGGALHAVIPGTKDALPDLHEEEDAASRWLRENDPNYKKN